MIIVRPEPDDLCPSCGVPVPFQRRSAACPHCGHEFGPPRPDPQVTGYLTPFGYGMCGLIAGGQLGATAALSAETLRIGDPRLLLFPIAGGVACALIAAAVGRRLHASVRRGYEALMLALALACILVFMLALIGVRSLDALAATGVCALALGTPLVWRVLFRRKQDRIP